MSTPTKIIINPARMDAFMAVYEPALRDAVIKHPDEYRWPVEDVPVVAGKMRAAIERGSANKDGPAFRAACKALGIKHTYTAIYEYLGTFPEGRMNLVTGEVTWR